MAQYTPLQDNWGEIVIRQGHGMPNMNEDIGSSWDHVNAGYLETLGQKILRGRSITEDDTASTQKVAVVNEAFVKRFFKPGEEPVGAHFGLDLPQFSATYEIVGRSAQCEVPGSGRDRSDQANILCAAGPARAL